MAIFNSLSAILFVLLVTGAAASTEGNAYVHSHAATLRSILLQQTSAEEPEATMVPDASSSTPISGADLAASTRAGQPGDVPGIQGVAAGITSLLAGQPDPTLSAVAPVIAPAGQGEGAPALGGFPNIAALQQNTGTAKLGAFGQIATLDAEFQALHADDQNHIRQLSFNVHLREKLRQQLSAVQQQLLNDNLQLAKRTATIVGSGGAAASPSGTVDNVNGTSAVPVALLQQRQLTSEQIAADALQRVKALEADIVALRTRDEAEVRALRNNADMRTQLGQRIVAQRTQLQKDAGSLLADLGQIRNLAGPEESHKDAEVATTAAPQSEAA